jgi:hypothetical protein
MSVAIQVLGLPGTGKTYSMKDLDPSVTFYISCDKKSMPFRGWRNSYSKEKKNYLVTSDAVDIMSYLKLISDKLPNIKTVVIDTVSSIMSDKEMSERKKKGFDKWLDYAGDIYDLYSLASSSELRDDLIVVFMGHTEYYQDNSITKQRLLTGGAKLTKLNLEGKLTYTLYTSVEFESGKPEYYFVTQTDGTTSARSPEGCFEFRIPNDLNYVINRIKEFEYE